MALAERVVVEVPSENVAASTGLLTIDIALPAEVVGKRVDRCFVELPIVVGESTDAAFNTFPMVELYEASNPELRQTVLLLAEHRGLLRIDVTNLVRAWTTVDTRQFVVGTVSEDNKTVFEIETYGGWATGTAARLVVEYRNRDRL
jgi:hypothetical protein